MDVIVRLRGADIWRQTPPKTPALPSHRLPLLLVVRWLVSAAVLFVGSAAFESSSGARATWARAVHASYGSVRVSHAGHFGYAEPYLAVDATNNRVLLGASQLYRPGAALPVAVAFVSLDGGRTWPRERLLAIPTGFTHVFDTTVAFSSAGIGYVSAMAVGGSGREGSGNRAIVMWTTATRGQTFTGPRILARGQLLDHPWISTDPSHHTIYLAFADLLRNRILFSRSLDGGTTFSTPRAIVVGAGTVGDPVIAAGPRGSVNAVFYLRPPGHSFTIATVHSSDYGSRFSRPMSISGIPAGSLVYTGKRVPSSRVAAAFDPVTGALYVAYSEHTSSRRAQIFVSRSVTGGGKWIKPVLVDRAAGPGRLIAQQPQVAIGKSGRVWVFYFAQTSPSNMRAYLAGSPSGGRMFGPPLQLSPSFDPNKGITSIRPGSWWVGDYQGLTVAAGWVYAFWNDTRTGKLQIYIRPVRDSEGSRQST